MCKSHVSPPSVLPTNLVMFWCWALFCLRSLLVAGVFLGAGHKDLAFQVAVLTPSLAHLHLPEWNSPLQVWLVKGLLLVMGGCASRNLVVFHAVSHCTASLGRAGVLGAEQSWVLEWGCAWGSCLQVNSLWLEHITALDEASGHQQEAVPKCKRNYLHVSTRTASSWGSPAPKYYHGHAVSCCLPAPCAPPSLWELHTLSCWILISLASSSTPLSHLPGASSTARLAVGCGSGSRAEAGWVHAGCSACTSCPPSQPGACAVQVSTRVLQSIFLGLVCEINHCCWNQLSLQLQAGWLDVLLLLASRVDVDSIVCVGKKKKSSRNNYRVSSLNDQVFSE